MTVESTLGRERERSLIDIDPNGKPEPGASNPARAYDPIAVLDVDESLLDQPDASIARTLTDRAIERARKLLELGYFVGNTDPTDVRGPRLDVFVIGDIGDPRVAGAAPPLCRALAQELRSRFRPILGAGDGHLAVCPMLVAPRSRTSAVPDSMATCITELAEFARHPEHALRPLARVYIVEDQSGKYLLPIRELVRSFAAFLSLVFESELRDDRSVRDLIEDTGDSRSGPLATFACATIEIDMALLSELCAYQLARDMLEHYHQGQLTLSEIASEAHPLVPERATLEAHLWREGDDGTLEDYLEPPPLPVPNIGWTDSPEQIIEQKFGPAWRDETQHRFDTFRDQVERFKMDRLAKRIEKNGTALATDAEDALMKRVRREALASPRGPERALEFARYAATRARGLMDESRNAIDSPNLQSLPDSPIARGVESIAEASRAWPRTHPARISIFGWLAVLIGAFTIGGVAHIFLHLLVDDPAWWWSGAIGLLVCAASIRYTVWSHIKRHHNWLIQTRYDLEQALQRYVQRDMVDYFRRRLAYTRDLWTYRIYRRLTGRLDELVVQLEGARAAVDTATRRLTAWRHDLRVRRLGDEAHGILYRTVLENDTVDAFYRHTRPPDLAALAARYHTQITEEDPHAEDTRDILEAPYADPKRALAFCHREFAHLLDISPYEQSDSPLFSAVEASVRRYFEELALKLSPPLEVIASRAGDAPAASRIAVGPPEARDLIERILKSGNLDRGFSLRSVSNDARRIHLLIERGHLPVPAVAVASNADRQKTAPPTTPEGKVRSP